MSDKPLYMDGFLQEQFIGYLTAAFNEDTDTPISELPVPSLPRSQYLALEDAFYAGAQSFLIGIVNRADEEASVVIERLMDELENFGQNIVARHNQEDH